MFDARRCATSNSLIILDILRYAMMSIFLNRNFVITCQHEAAVRSGFEVDKTCDFVKHMDYCTGVKDGRVFQRILTTDRAV
jgi:hypothetical protein